MNEAQVTDLKKLLREGAMPGMAVGSGWTNKAVRALVAEQFQVTYKQERDAQAVRAFRLELSTGAQALSSPNAGGPSAI